MIIVFVYLIPNMRSHERILLLGRSRGRANAGAPLQSLCGLLARALERLDIHLELGRYAFEREWLESNRKEYEVLQPELATPFLTERTISKRQSTAIANLPTT